MFHIPFNIERSISVNKPISEVYQALADFNCWTIWSPWFIQEPESDNQVIGQVGTLGHQQSWNGQRIGSGRIELIECQADQRLAYDLFFLAPWKSHSKTQFELTSITNAQGEAATQVTWLMQGTLPFFLFFMKKMMSVFVGGDYERGLAMFKEYMETGTVTSSVKVNDISEQSGFYYVGQPLSCTTNEMSDEVEPLANKLKAAHLPKPDFLLTLVKDFNPMTKQADIVFAFGYHSKPDIELSGDMVDGTVPAHQAQSVTHTGNYFHLANGWSTLMNYLRFAKLKQNKKVKAYEIYLNDPDTTPGAQRLTQIFAPIK